jgi:hypothetical protein
LGVLVGTATILFQPGNWTFASICQNLLFYQMTVTLTLSGLISFFGHVFKSDSVAESIGWAKGSPFQKELGYAELGYALAGVMCIFYGREFWLAAIVLTSPLYLLAGINHIKEMIVEKTLLLTIHGRSFLIYLCLFCGFCFTFFQRAKDQKDSLKPFASFCWYYPDNDLCRRGNSFIYLNQYPTGRNSTALDCNINEKLCESLRVLLGLNGVELASEAVSIHLQLCVLRCTLMSLKGHFSPLIVPICARVSRWLIIEACSERWLILAARLRNWKKGTTFRKTSQALIMTQ